MIAAALLLAAQAPATPTPLDQRQVAMEQQRSAWMVCVEIAAKAWAVTFPALPPSEIADAALGHCLTEEDAFSTAALRYIGNNFDERDKAVGQLRARERQRAAAVVLEYRARNEIRNPRTK